MSTRAFLASFPDVSSIMAMTLVPDLSHLRGYVEYDWLDALAKPQEWCDVIEGAEDAEQLERLLWLIRVTARVRLSPGAIVSDWFAIDHPVTSESMKAILHHPLLGCRQLAVALAEPRASAIAQGNPSLAFRLVSPSVAFHQILLSSIAYATARAMGPDMTNDEIGEAAASLYSWARGTADDRGHRPMLHSLAQRLRVVALSTPTEHTREGISMAEYKLSVMMRDTVTTLLALGPAQNGDGNTALLIRQLRVVLSLGRHFWARRFGLALPFPEPPVVGVLFGDRVH